MELMSERSRLPLHLTYRAVGSTGQKEFLDDTNGYKSLNDFGSGDIPMTKSGYDSLVASGRQMVRTCFALGGIGVFHSVPTSRRSTSRDASSRVFSSVRSRHGTTPTSAPSTRSSLLRPDQGRPPRAGIVFHREYRVPAQKCPESWDLGKLDDHVA